MHFLALNHASQQVTNFIIEEQFLTFTILISNALMEILISEALVVALLV